MIAYGQTRERGWDAQEWTTAASEDGGGDREPNDQKRSFRDVHVMRVHVAK